MQLVNFSLCASRKWIEISRLHCTTKQIFQLPYHNYDFSLRTRRCPYNPIVDNRYQQGPLYTYIRNNPHNLYKSTARCMCEYGIRIHQNLRIVFHRQ